MLATEDPGSMKLTLLRVSTFQGIFSTELETHMDLTGVTTASLALLCETNEGKGERKARRMNKLPIIKKVFSTFTLENEPGTLRSGDCVHAFALAWKPPHIRWPQHSCDERSFLK
jgi:hypothetical protein